MIMIQLGPEQGKEFRQVTNERGSQLGYFSLSAPDLGSVFLYQVVVYEPGRGTGTAIYKAIGREVGRKGLALISDPDSFSYSAFRLWQSLERCGNAARLDDRSTTYVDDRGDVYGAAFRLNNEQMPITIDEGWEAMVPAVDLRHLGDHVGVERARVVETVMPLNRLTAQTPDAFSV